ncbi:MAG TPA: DUF11 domain-containing protein [Thermoanaerobaculia bacterium]|nr:DUF11 domain-containing protein [Thermoanaerobaculia bacterium]
MSLLVLSLAAFGQSADQEVVSAVDSPDPVAPGATLTYTVTVRNNGPDPATNGGLNINLPLAVTHTTDVVPAGWTCFWLGNNGSCITPTFAAGVTEVIVINTTVSASLANFPDQSISANFFPSGTTTDPNSANNMKTATTLVNSPQVDLYLSVTDSPDPVFPDGTVTYTVPVTNGGPDTASSVNFNVVPNSSLAFQSATVPAGWTCTLPSVGAINATFTCSRATWAPGTDTFIVAFKANDEQFGINDTTFQTFFGVNAGGSNETDTSDNSETETTAYTTPDADVYVSVTDSPDPVFPDGNITYTVTVGNNGPDLAPSINLNSFGSNNLRFVSASVPAGWNCTLPAAGAQTPGYTCTLPGGMVSGGTNVLTFVMQADDALIGISDTTIQFGFSANSTVSDPNNTNNSETESTAYVTPDADVYVTVSDSPDPVFPDGNITYTVTVGNNGPDLAPSITLSSFGSNNLRFVSASVPAGWNCTLPAAGAQTPGYSCTLPGGMVSGGADILTFVMQADDALIGINDTTIQFGFGANSTVSDPNNSNNTETESTAYVTPDADLAVTAADAPDPVAAGSNITYTGTVANNGPDTATSTSFSINLAAGLLFQSLTGPAGFACATPAVGANGPITCTSASFASGAPIPFTLVAQVANSLNNGPDGTITQSFVISSSNVSDPTQSNNTVTLMTAYTTPDANIAVTNADAPDPVAPGGTITYTQSITNNGPDSATTATFTQNVPAGTTFQSLAFPAGWTCGTPAVGGTGVINCSKPAMISGETGAFTLVVNVTATSGTITSQVTGGSATYDPVSPNNTASTTTTVISTPFADLSITKSTPTTSAPVGSLITYTIVLTNNGPDAAPNPVMTDTLPASLLFRSISAPAGFTCTTPAFRTNGTITCNATTLANGASATFTLVVEVASGATGTIVNSAGATSNATDSNGGNSSGSSPAVTAAPATTTLGITKTTGTTSATPGTIVNYLITVTNSGPSTATSVTVNDTLPSSLQFVSATPSQGTCNAASPLACNLGTILAGANATVALQVRVVGTSGTFSNTATASAPEGQTVSATTPPATITIVAAEVTPIPTLSEWMLLALAALLSVIAMVKVSSRA